MTDTIYIAPDIRKQKLEEAQSFIEQKRMKRLVLYNTMREKEAEKANKLHGKELERFVKRMELLKKSLERIEDTINRAEDHMRIANEINHTLHNLENAQKFEPDH